MRLIWAKGALGNFDLDQGVVDRSIEAMEEGRLYDWEEVRRGSQDSSDLPIKSKLRLAKMAGRAVRALRG